MKNTSNRTRMPIRYWILGWVLSKGIDLYERYSALRKSKK